MDGWMDGWMEGWIEACEQCSAFLGKVKLSDFCHVGEHMMLSYRRSS